MGEALAVKQRRERHLQVCRLRLLTAAKCTETEQAEAQQRQRTGFRNHATRIQRTLQAPVANLRTSSRVTARIAKRTEHIKRIDNQIV